MTLEDYAAREGIPINVARQRLVDDRARPDAARRFEEEKRPAAIRGRKTYIRVRQAPGGALGAQPGNESTGDS